MKVLLPTKTNTMKSLKIAFILALSFITLSSFTIQKEFGHGHWTLVGSKKVNMHGDHDEMYVTGWQGAFTKLSFKVENAPIYVRNVKVVYSNGTSENHYVNQRYAANERSRALDLNGRHRIIKKIVFNYDTINNGNGKAKVLAFGKH